MFIYDNSSTVPVPSLVEGANNLSKTFVKCIKKKHKLGILFFPYFYFENLWKKPAKTRTRLLRVRVLQGYKFTYPDPYPRDPYP